MSCSCSLASVRPPSSLRFSTLAWGSPCIDCFAEPPLILWCNSREPASGAHPKRRPPLEEQYRRSPLGLGRLCLVEPRDPVVSIDLVRNGRLAIRVRTPSGRLSHRLGDRGACGNRAVKKPPLSAERDVGCSFHRLRPNCILYRAGHREHVQPDRGRRALLLLCRGGPRRIAEWADLPAAVSLRDRLAWRGGAFDVLALFVQRRRSKPGPFGDDIRVDGRSSLRVHRRHRLLRGILGRQSLLARASVASSGARAGTWRSRRISRFGAEF